MNNLLIGAVILMLIVLPLTGYYSYKTGFKAGETDCQTKSQKAVIENQARYQVELKKAATKAKNRRRIITGLQNKLRHSDNDVCADSRISDIRAKLVRDTLCSLLPKDSRLRNCPPSQ